MRAKPLPVVLSTPPKGRVLAIAPHPDDEIIGPGGTLILHARQGDPIRVVFVCSGVHGDPDGLFPKDGYEALRKAESAAVARAHLGNADLRFYGYPDGLDDHGLAKTFPAHPADPDERPRALVYGLSENLAKEIADFDAKTVYYPWDGEFHPDHWAVGAAVENLRKGRPDIARGRSFLGYEVWSTLVPDTLVDITSVFDEKKEAVRKFRTQTAYFDYAAIVGGLNAHRGLLMQRRASGHAEAFIGRYSEGESS